MAKSKIDKCMKKIDKYDISLIKISSISFVLFLLKIWPGFMNLVNRIHWGWFLGATVIFAWRPFKKYLKA